MKFRHEISLMDYYILRQRLQAVAQPDIHGENGERPDMSQMPNMEEFEGQFSDSMMPDRGFETGMNESLSDIIWILVSIVVLIVGMIVAYKFKGKNE